MPTYRTWARAPARDPRRVPERNTKKVWSVMGTRGKGILMKAPRAVSTAKRAERVMILTGKRMAYLHCQPKI
jgi:hypothetical protein